MFSVLIYETIILGVIRIASKDCEELCDKLKMINQSLEIKDQNGENLLLRYDNYDELLEEYNNGLKELQ